MKLSGLLKKWMLNETAPGNETAQNNGGPAQKAPPKQPVPPTLALALDEFRDCGDLTHRHFPEQGLDLIYFEHLIDQKKLNDQLLIPLIGGEETALLLGPLRPFAVFDSNELVNGVLAGGVAIFAADGIYVLNVYGSDGRTVSQSDTETVITGPHEAFTEQASVSMALIRNRVKSSKLKVIKLGVGEITKTDVYVMYIQDIVNMDYVREVKKRIENIEVDAIFDTNMLIQYIDDNKYSIFPQYLTSERPDAIASKLASGRVVGLVDGSPSAFTVPTSFFEFFSSSDDYYQRWILGSATRLLRFLAFVITISFTALYVSMTTFHYEMIPENLLLTLTESRSRVPFPPVYEALVMEVTIELLREASARLPTKIGQTIGIVGGIVIGQAAVQAGLTSNVLIIAVASSAIASFVIPSYVMSASIRLIRFGLILLAGLWGNFGLVVGVSAIVIHLCGVTSLGTSYMTPIAPFQLRDWKDIFIRAPFNALRLRPTQSATSNKERNKTRR